MTTVPAQADQMGIATGVMASDATASDGKVGIAAVPVGTGEEMATRVDVPARTVRGRVTGDIRDVPLTDRGVTIGVTINVVTGAMTTAMAATALIGAQISVMGNGAEGPTAQIAANAAKAGSAMEPAGVTEVDTKAGVHALNGIPTAVKMVSAANAVKVSAEVSNATPTTMVIAVRVVIEMFLVTASVAAATTSVALVPAELLSRNLQGSARTCQLMKTLNIASYPRMRVTRFGV
jgi:hypothetical protein